MTKEFVKMLEILRFGVLGTKPQMPIDADLNEVCRLALNQGILPLVFGALEPEQKKMLDPKWEQMFFRAMIKNEQKLAALSGVLKRLETENIPYCILKGCTVAKDYHLPECRLSGDIDLYVCPEFEKTVSSLLERMGMNVEDRPTGHQDFKASSPGVGLIEVHVRLYSEIFNREVLNDKFGITENFQDVKINDFLTVKSLGVNDTLDFLTIHFIKHFVREGSGIRQITDLLAFLNRHRDEIDFERYLKRFEEVRFKKLVLNVLGIGVKYFGMEFGSYDLENVEALMMDVELGENFGTGDSSRIGFYEQFLVKRNQNEGGAKKTIAQKKRTVLKSVFLPHRGQLLKKGYVYLEKSPLLYPVAYVHRLWDVLLLILRGKRSVKNTFAFAQEENNIIDERMKMMKDLDVI